MLSPLGRLGSTVRRSLTLVGSLVLKLGPIRRVLLLVASIAAVVILGSLLLALVLTQG
jgi:hypothetical protein